MARGAWRLTVRHGSRVQKLRFESAQAAIDGARDQIDRVRREGNLPPIFALRDFEPGQRVHARIEVSGPGLLRPPQGGIDVTGDGSVVAYTGAVRKQPLGADTIDELLERLRSALVG